MTMKDNKPRIGIKQKPVFTEEKVTRDCERIMKIFFEQTTNGSPKRKSKRKRRPLYILFCRLDGK